MGVPYRFRRKMDDFTQSAAEIKNAGMRWRRNIEWTTAMSQFAIQFGSRFPGSTR
jgi:hypothetical protein